MQNNKSNRNDSLAASIVLTEFLGEISAFTLDHVSMKMTVSIIWQTIKLMRRGVYVWLCVCAWDAGCGDPMLWMIGGENGCKICIILLGYPIWIISSTGARFPRRLTFGCEANEIAFFYLISRIVVTSRMVEGPDRKEEGESGKYNMQMN